jgi:hypothetical protein
MSAPNPARRAAPARFPDDPLWNRLSAYDFDDPAAQLPFSQRLARENGWSRHYACRIIEEYRKFCYLAMTVGHGVTPSDAVDQAWHLHLLYTQRYWHDFCRGVLGRSLHHGPTSGGAEEAAKFSDSYEATLDSYRATFGYPPPADIWPVPKVRFARFRTFRRIDTASCWIVPKPRFLLWRRERESSQARWGKRPLS